MAAVHKMGSKTLWTKAAQCSCDVRGISNLKENVQSLNLRLIFAAARGQVESRRGNQDWHFPSTPTHSMKRQMEPAGALLATSCSQMALAKLGTRASSTSCFPGYCNAMTGTYSGTLSEFGQLRMCTAEASLVWTEALNCTACPAGTFVGPHGNCSQCACLSGSACRWRRECSSYRQAVEGFCPAAAEHSSAQLGSVCLAPRAHASRCWFQRW